MYSIAKKYNTTVNKLKELNNLTSNILTVGQTLNLSSSNLNNNPNIYIIKPGDTLYKIANQNNTTINKLKELNNLTTDILTIGNTLLLPTTEIIEIPTISNTYTVKKGDTLYSIATNNNTTVDKLKQLNNLTSNILTIGQTLKIPTTEIIEIPTTTITHIVEPGETLYSIAREYNTTVNNIMKLNNLTTSLLNVGQKLII